MTNRDGGLEPAIITRVRDALLSGVDRLEAQQRQPVRDLWRAALGLEHVIQSDLLAPAEERAVLAGMDPARTQLCQEIFCAFETTIENSFAAMALGGAESLLRRADGITENYLSRYEELARKEIALSTMTGHDRALFVGSGPFPITAIEYARQTGCTVDCVDCVPEAVETSREVLRRLGLADRVRPRLARGEHVPVTGYSVVLVGVLAQPKQEIFANILATWSEGCRIIARTTAGLRELIYRPTSVDLSLLPGMSRAGANVARGDQVISADLYRSSAAAGGS